MSKVGEYYRELQQQCDHIGYYQPAEYETNVAASYTCENCGIDLPMPTPDCDL